MKKEILRKLHEIEIKENVKILFAAESGSRAWGFASPDSDYDVRFIYVRPKEEYLRLDTVKDVIEVPINEVLDINGWDLQKTLRLLYKSNPTLFEWFSSPIVYMETEFADEFRAMMMEYFSTKRSLHHYINMAERNYKNISYRGAFKASCERIGLTTEYDELDWILHQCKCPVLFYDEMQVVGPSGIDVKRFRTKMKMEQAKRLMNYYNLLTQMRVKGGNDYIAYVQDILSGEVSRKRNFLNYDLILMKDFVKFNDLMCRKEKEVGLVRMAAGYAWEWISKNDKSVYDIEIQGIKKQWNHCTEGWVHSENAINEIGCIHSIQGYDLNYAFIILGNEIGYDPDKKRIIIRAENYYDQNGKKTAGYEELKEYIQHIYYVLMTRGIRGTYLYICDPDLRGYISQYVDTE